MQAAKEAVDHFTQAKPRVHKVTQKLLEMGMCDCFPFPEQQNLHNRLLNWDPVLGFLEELRLAHLPIGYREALEQLRGELKPQAPTGYRRIESTTKAQCRYLEEQRTGARVWLWPERTPAWRNEFAAEQLPTQAYIEMLR